MKIELLHSITHDGQEYLPGLHDLPADLAELFLKSPWAAVEYKPTEARAGAVKEAPGMNFEGEKTATGQAPAKKKN